MSIYASTQLPSQDTLTGRLELAPEVADKPRRFDMVAYTGAPVTRAFGSAVFDLSAVELPPGGRLPILLNHDDNQIVGYADQVQVGDQITMSGVICDTEHGRKVAKLADQGFTWQASIGIQVHEWTAVKEGETVRCNGRDLDGPVYMGSKTRLLEASFVPAGADNHTRAVALTSLTPEIEEAPVTEATPAPEAVDLAAAVAELKEALEAAKDEIKSLKQVEKLEQETRHPGVGFTPAEASQPSKPKDFVSLWESDVELRADFGGRAEYFAAWVERHPDEAQRLLESK